MKKTLLFIVLPLLSILLQAQETVVVDGVTFSADKKTLIKYPKDKTDEKYVVREGTEVIGEEAIWDNDFLRVLTLPSSLKEIGDYALMASNLSTIIWDTYPAVVGEGIWRYAGANQSNLSSFLTTENSDNCISVDGVLFSRDKKKLLGFPPAKIGDRLEGKYEVPEGTEVIAKEAFLSADIAEIVLPSTMRRIEDEAFLISELAYSGDYRAEKELRKVFCRAMTPPEIIGNPFIAPRYIDLHVPEESADIYRNDDYWKFFKTINGQSEGSGIPQIQQSVDIRAWFEENVLYLESEKTISEIKVFDTNGICSWSENAYGKERQISTALLSKGVLLLEVTTIDRKRTEIKLLN